MSGQVTVQKREAQNSTRDSIKALGKRGLPVRETGRVRRLVERLNERNAVENELYFVITYLYGLATSYCSLEDMFTYVAQSEFKSCGRLFDRVSELATTWHFGFVNALEGVAKQVKGPLLKDFLERFSQMLKTGDLYDRFLMMEHEAYTAAYEAEYERKLHTMETLGNAYSAIISSVTFGAITLTLTQALIGSSTGSDFTGVTTQLAIALVATLLLSVFVLYITSPIDKIVYLHKDLRIPKEFKTLRAFLPISIAIGVAASTLAAFTVPTSDGSTGWILLGISIPLLPVGVMAKRADTAIKARENAFPTFIRTLGTTAGITSYSTARTLKLLLVRDFGVLSTQVRALHSRLSIGVDSNLCWKNLASECGSELIRIFGGIYEATVSLGGDPSEIGKMISRNMIRRLVLRAKRIQVASGIRAMIYPLHIIECALLAFMTTLLQFLVNMVNIGSQFSMIGIFKSSINASSIAPVFTTIMIVLAISNALTLKIAEVSNNYRLVYHLSVLLLLTGVTILGVSVAVDVFFKNMFKLDWFQGISS
jgi:flagellar protein FlaJ